MATFKNDTISDASAAASRKTVAEKPMPSQWHSRKCPHCGHRGLVFHCADKKQCTWLRCPHRNCLAIIDPSDWGHSHPSHPAGLGRVLSACAA